MRVKGTLTCDAELAASADQVVHIRERGNPERGNVPDRVEHRRHLTPEQKWQIFRETSRKNTSVSEVCRRWGITRDEVAAEPPREET